MRYGPGRDGIPGVQMQVVSDRWRLVEANDRQTASRPTSACGSPISRAEWHRTSVPEDFAGRRVIIDGKGEAALSEPIPAGTAGASMPAVVADSLTKRFGSVLAVDSLSFALAPGTITGLSRPERCRQDDNTADAARTRQAERRQRSDLRPPLRRAR